MMKKEPHLLCGSFLLYLRMNAFFGSRSADIGANIGYFQAPLLLCITVVEFIETTTFSVAVISTSGS